MEKREFFRPIFHPLNILQALFPLYLHFHVRWIGVVFCCDACLWCLLVVIVIVMLLKAEKFSLNTELLGTAFSIIHLFYEKSSSTLAGTYLPKDHQNLSNLLPLRSQWYDDSWLLNLIQRFSFRNLCNLVCKGQTVFRANDTFRPSNIYLR